MFIDFHCHPSLIAFNRMRDTKKEQSDKFNLAFHDEPDTNKLYRLGHYTQSDLISLTKGGVRCACVYLYVPERDLFIGRKKEIRCYGLKRMFKECRNLFIRGKSPIRIWAASFGSSFPISRVRYLQSKGYDYFEEFKKTLNFYEKDAGKELSQVKGNSLKYQIAKSYKGIKDNKDCVTFILNIEGGHVFSGGASQYKVSIDEMLRRINFIKTQLPYPIFTLTLAHLFYNSLCGHCRSLHPNQYWIADQEHGMNACITKEGDLVIKKLLNLDNKSGMRILIDIKHMSIQAREEYYKKYIVPYNEKHKDEKIPIVASHIAYSGIDSINKMKEISKREINSAPPEYGEFHSGTYNLCDEEIQLISKSEGIIGLVLAKRFLTSKAKRRSMKDMKDPYEWGRVIANHIVSLVKVMALIESDRKAKRKVWNRICLGSDFDGFNEPPDTFYDASTYHLLEKVLIDVLKDWPSMNNLLFGLSIEEVVDKFMFQNAYEFLKKHLR